MNFFKNYDDGADYIVIGTGAAGATASKVLSDHKEDVLIVEAGSWVSRSSGETTYQTIFNRFKDYGMQIARGRSLIPLVQGSCVGGSTTLSGGAVYRLPENIYDEWSADPAILKRLSYETIKNNMCAIENELRLNHNSSQFKDTPIAHVLNKLGWSYQFTPRFNPLNLPQRSSWSASPCGGSNALDMIYMPKVIENGGRVLSDSYVERVIFEGSSAIGVCIKNQATKKKIYLKANKGIFVAAGAIESPLLLMRSGIKNNQLGRNLQLHPGVQCSAIFDDIVVNIEGVHEGLEISQFFDKAIKIARSHLPPELLLSRTKIFGDELTNLLMNYDKISNFTGSIRAGSKGRVYRGLSGKTVIDFDLSENDTEKLRLAIEKITELFFCMNARKIFPEVYGLSAVIRKKEELKLFQSLSLDPRNYSVSASHIFGTCRMGASYTNSVVSPEFKVHGKKGLYVIDASVFPTNIGVNPQLSVMSLATIAVKQAIMESI